MDQPLPDSHPLRKAHWIWPWEQQDCYNAYACFRRDFSLDAIPSTAPFHISADQQYLLYINGHYLGRGPARGFQCRWPFDTYDLTPLLRTGANWISVLAHNPGVGTFQYLYGGRPGFICAGQWDDLLLTSDARWLGRISAAHRRYTAKLSKQLGLQEHLDCRLDDRDWISSATPPGVAWGQLLMQLPFGSLPWDQLEPRNLPNLSHELIPYARIIATARGQCQEHWHTWEDPGTGWRAERASLAWQNAVDAPGPVHELPVPATGADAFHAILLDLGQPGVGTFAVHAHDAHGGEILDLHGCEWLDDDGGPHVPHANERVSLVTRLTLRPGETRCDTMPLIGHRYLTVVVRGAMQPFRLQIHLRQSLYPLEIQGRFDSSDEILNDIHRLCVHTQRICMLDSYVDTPWREQAQWWGDARVQAWNTFHLAPDPRLLERGIRQIARQRIPNGLTFAHAPTIAQDCVLPDFSLIWCLTLYDHYWQTGDPRLFQDHWPDVQRLLGYFDTEGCGPDGLLIHDPRYWLFLDWTQINRDGTPTLLNLWYCHTLTTLAELALAAGHHEAVDELESRQNRIKPLILARLYDSEAGLFHDGYLLDGARVERFTVQNQTLAILSGLVPEAHERMVNQVLGPCLASQRREPTHPNAYWITYVYTVMRRLGFDRLVLDHLKRHWTPMIPYGGCSEHFFLDPATGRPPPQEGGSFSHAWSAHPLFHLMETLGGVTQRAPAWKTIAFRPLLETRGRSAVTTPTPHGLIHSGWTAEAGHIVAYLELPDGVEADIRLPGVTPHRVAGRNSWKIHPAATKCMPFDLFN